MNMLVSVSVCGKVLFCVPTHNPATLPLVTLLIHSKHILAQHCPACQPPPVALPCVSTPFSCIALPLNPLQLHRPASQPSQLHCPASQLPPTRLASQPPPVAFFFLACLRPTNPNCFAHTLLQCIAVPVQEEDWWPIFLTSNFFARVLLR